MLGIAAEELSQFPVQLRVTWSCVDAGSGNCRTCTNIQNWKALVHFGHQERSLIAFLQPCIIKGKSTLLTVPGVSSCSASNPLPSTFHFLICVIWKWGKNGKRRVKCSYESFSSALLFYHQFSLYSGIYRRKAENTVNVFNWGKKAARAYITGAPNFPGKQRVSSK